MPSISACPECHRDLTIPDVDDPGRSLRCPLCDAQFPAQRILTDSVRFPPLAIVVGEDHASPSAGDLPPYSSLLRTIGSGGLSPGLGFDPLSSPETKTPQNAFIGDLAAAQSAADHSTQFAADSAEETDVRVEDDEEELPPLAAREEVFSHSEGRPRESDDALGDVAVDTGDAAPSIEFERAAVRVAAQSRRRASPWGAMGQLIGMAIGGALGLAIGYWILLWINPQADFLKLRGKLPAWMMPSGRHQRLPVEDQATAPVGVPERSLADLLDEPDAAADSASEAESSVQPADFRQADLADSNDHLQVAAGAATQQPSAAIGPRGFTPHSSAELKAALDAAAGTLRCEYCQGKQRSRPVDENSTAPDSSTASAEDKPSRKIPRCEHCRGTGVGNITLPVFERLCQLAEVATFAQLDDTDEAAQEKYRDAAQDLLLLVGADRSRGEVIGRLAADRLDDSQRPSNGIILCGSVAQTRYQGDLFAMRIVLSGIARTVTVVSRDAPDPPFGPRDHVLILGSIIDSPKNNLAGYEGDEPQVVWGGVPFKLGGASGG